MQEQLPDYALGGPPFVSLAMVFAKVALLTFVYVTVFVQQAHAVQTLLVGVDLTLSAEHEDTCTEASFKCAEVTLL